MRKKYFPTLLDLLSGRTFFLSFFEYWRTFDLLSGRTFLKSLPTLLIYVRDTPSNLPIFTFPTSGTTSTLKSALLLLL